MMSPSCDIRAWQDGVTFNCTDRETREIVVIALIDARHFGRFAPDKSTAGFPASDTDAGNHRGPDFWFKFPTGIVVKKKKGLGTLDHQIVHAHRDQINADSVVAAGFDGDLELGSDAIGRRNQYRVAIAYPLEIKKPAKSPNLGVCARAGGSPDQRLDQLDHSVAGVDINTGLRVSETARFFCHRGPRPRRVLRWNRKSRNGLSAVILHR